MTIEILKETAEMAHLNPDEGELAGIFPAFAELIGFFDTMQAAEEDRAAFPEEGSRASLKLHPVGSRRRVPEGLDPTAPSLAGANAPPNENVSESQTESLLDNSGERDGRFFVIPNVL